MKFILLVISVLIFEPFLCQNKLPKSNGIFDKPKFDSNKKFLVAGFNDKSERVDYMKSNMAFYCLKEKNYTGIKRYINYDFALVDMREANHGEIITLKISENSVFVFMLHNISNSEDVNVTSYRYQFGEIDKSSIKSVNLKKNRVLLSNNIFTEELSFGQVKFIIENKTTYKKVICAGKEIILEAFDYDKDRYNFTTEQ